MKEISHCFLYDVYNTKCTEISISNFNAILVIWPCLFVRYFFRIFCWYLNSTYICSIHVFYFFLRHLILLFFITVLDVQGIYNNMDKCVLDLSLVMEGWFVCMEITACSF